MTMRLKLTVLTAMTITLASCGPKQLALSSDPVDRAATCAVVSAADARAKSPDVAGALDFESQTRILHYAMLTGVQGDDFSTKTASSVVQRMSQVEGEITNGKWQELVKPCDQAFPVARKTAGIELPKNKFDAQLGCYALGEFLVRTVNTTDPAVQQRLSELMQMRRDLDGTIGSGLKARGASGVVKTRALKHAALVQMTNLGAPAEVMKQCTARFT